MCANLMTAIPCEMVCECSIVLYGTSVMCVCVHMHACQSVVYQLMFMQEKMPHALSACMYYYAI